ncbi:RluA family pseudouridine synthase [Paenibacillus tarimensis]|uniref:RluA family pseudouridine synthase n=1 Tax=Paenibacillus tarimensis TaxID=416012 RepID=UPI001F38EA4E|nr:RluA family pseudouridine synthase [Paenibacillus tarimensis]MCF2942625.1 RluA family pseudouridine synthase [Paenibacillus tarimensis]
MLHRIPVPSYGDISVLYEDNHILAVIKPPGVPSQEDDSGAPDMLTLLKADIKERYNKPGNVYLGLVHRLDRPVGGVMLFAKTSKAASRLSESVRSRSFHKCYTAVTNGIPADRSARLVHYLRKDSKTNTVQAFNQPGPDTKEAVLDYTSVAADQKQQSALIAVRLHTGRPHQIRVQMASVGSPLAGDRKYGRPAGRSSTGMAHEDIALWSAFIGIDHPVTKEWMSFRAAPPRTGFWAAWSSEELESACTCYMHKGDERLSDD